MALTDLLFCRPHVVAVVSGLIFPLSCLLSYSLAILLGHLEPVVTYISDTATDPPVSGIFGMLMTWCLVVFAVVSQMRHSYVRAVCSARPHLLTCHLRLAHSASGWLALLSIVAMALVPHFQVHTSLVVHGLGAFFGLGCGVAYFCFQVVCSRAMVPEFTSPAVLRLRLALAATCVVCYVVGGATGALSVTQYDGAGDLHRWLPSDGGYVAHAVSSVCEWVLAVVYSAYFFSYASEFKKIKIQPAKVLLADERHQTLVNGSGNGNIV